MYRAYWLVAVPVTFVLTAGCFEDDGNGGGGSIDRPTSVFGVLGGMPNEVVLVWSEVPGATAYDIYMSPDNGSYTKIAQTPAVATVYFTGNGSTDCWYHVRALGNGAESSPSDPVWAMPSSVSHTLVCHLHGQTGVSRTPTISWDPVSGAETYYVVVTDASKVNTIWAVRTFSSETSVNYGSTSGSFALPAVENPLLPNTTYSLLVFALNFANWGSVDGIDEFTTGP